MNKFFLKEKIQTFLNEKSSQHLLKIDDWSYTEKMEATTYDKFQEWIDGGHHGSLNYLEGERGLKRQSLKKVFYECESSLIFLFSYAEFKEQLEHFYQSRQDLHPLKIAAYALAFSGLDYHFAIPPFLQEIGDFVKKLIPDLDIEMQIALDTSPILERDLAYRSGLGWMGKNSMLIHRRAGSYHMIATLLFNRKLPLEESLGREVETDHCGQCQACGEICPTDAIDLQKRILLADRCISTYTIEVFKQIPPLQNYPKEQAEIFGCDLCQEVCPWNKQRVRKSHYQEIDFLRSIEGFPVLKNLVNFFLLQQPEEILSQLDKMSNRQFRKLFASTPLARTGRIGLYKNLKAFLR